MDETEGCDNKYENRLKLTELFVYILCLHYVCKLLLLLNPINLILRWYGYKESKFDQQIKGGILQCIETCVRITKVTQC